MKLNVLKAIAKHFSTYQSLFSVRRIDDNLFRLSLDFDDFYIDASKSRSLIFKSDSKLLGNPYHAPFDLALSKYCQRAKILSCFLDGENRILIFELMQALGYKQRRYFLHFELTGRHTNVILVDEGGIVVEALHHISEHKSSRVIRPSKPFVPLNQPSISQTDQRELNLDELEEFLLDAYKQRMINRIVQKKQILITQREKKISDLIKYVQDLPSPDYLALEVKKYTLWGELIFSSVLPHYFSNPFELRDYEGRVFKIVLPSKIQSFSQAGNFCFTQAKRAKQKLKNLTIQKEYLESKLAFLKREIAYLDKIQDERDLQVFYPQRQRAKKEEKKNYESFFIDGIKVSIGKNSKENQILLGDARADDLWLHIKDIPSSHMIIHCGKAKVREEILYACAKLLLGMNGVMDKNISVDYTQRRFVKILEGANVFYSKQKTLRF